MHWTKPLFTLETPVLTVSDTVPTVYDTRTLPIGTGVITIEVQSLQATSVAVAAAVIFTFLDTVGAHINRVTVFTVTVYRLIPKLTVSTEGQAVLF